VSQKQTQSRLSSDDWVTVREFARAGTDEIDHEYQAKYVAEVGKKHVEDEIVLVKEVSSVGEGERIYHLPKEVFEEVVDRLP
jgi:hypothetical protein